MHALTWNIVWLGPDPLSRFNNPDNAVVPTLVSTMFEQGVISNNLFSIYFQPINGTSVESRINGNIIFGGGGYSLFILCCRRDKYIASLTVIVSLSSRFGESGEPRNNIFPKHRKPGLPGLRIPCQCFPCIHLIIISWQDYWAADMESIIVGDETVTFDSPIAALVDTGWFKGWRYHWLKWLIMMIQRIHLDFRAKASRWPCP